MLKNITKKQAADFMASLAKSKTGARRIMDDDRGQGLNAETSTGTVEAHATFAVFIDKNKITGETQRTRCYYADTRPQAVVDDDGNISRVIFLYNGFMVCYEKA